MVYILVSLAAASSHTMGEEEEENLGEISVIKPLTDISHIPEVIFTYTLCQEKHALKLLALILPLVEQGTFSIIRHSASYNCIAVHMLITKVTPSVN